MDFWQQSATWRAPTGCRGNTSFLLTFFWISDFSDLVRLIPTYSDLVRLIPTFLHFFRLFHSISLFFNSEVDSELPNVLRKINFKRVGGSFQSGMTMSVTISCKNQTKSVGTFPTFGTGSRNISNFWDRKSEHFLLLVHVGLT